MRIELYSPTQHPREVANACVKLIRRDADNPATVTLARKIIHDHVEPGWDVEGVKVPAALHSWAHNDITYIREPRTEWVAGVFHTYLFGGGDCDDLVTAQGTIAH